MSVSTGRPRRRLEERAPGEPRGAKVIVLPVRRGPRPRRWWERVLRRLRYGRLAAAGGA